MDAITLANRVIQQLAATAGIERAPYILVGREIFSPEELQAVPLDTIVQRWPDRVAGKLYAFHRYSQIEHLDCEDPSIWVFYTEYEPAKPELPMIIFWPPRHAGGEIEIAFSWPCKGGIEAELEALYWLSEQQIPAYAGIRRTIKFDIDEGRNKQICQPIPINKLLTSQDEH